MRTTVLRGCLALLALSLIGAGSRPEVRVSLQLPTGEVKAGQILQVPVMFTDGDNTVASYALRVRYSRRVLRVVRIEGGTFAGFSTAPVTNPASFSSGDTTFSANNAGLLETPDAYQAARIILEVIGEPGDRARLRVKRARRRGIFVDLESFAKMRLRRDRGAIFIVGSGD